MSIAIKFIIWIALIIADAFSLVWALFSIFGSNERFMQLMLAKDEAFNVAVGGKRNETLSRRSARAQLRGDRWGCILCKILNKIDKNHCEHALNSTD